MKKKRVKPDLVSRTHEEIPKVQKPRRQIHEESPKVGAKSEIKEKNSQRSPENRSRNKKRRRNVMNSPEFQKLHRQTHEDSPKVQKLPAKTLDETLKLLSLSPSMRRMERSNSSGEWPTKKGRRAEKGEGKSRLKKNDEMNKAEREGDLKEERERRKTAEIMQVPNPSASYVK